ncbi:MAG: single-stranded DNA-binding protein [Candidatus Thermoplasmatota archaeon]|nr:single-stranded DNA-binding protein [Candidatus Thermoplasmatota archaeon]
MEGATKIKDLNPSSRRVNVLGKVLSIGEKKAITTKFGEEKTVTEVIIADDTGKITLSLWGEQADKAKDGEVLYIDNGYVSLVRGHMRLNVGKYGALNTSSEDVGEINDSIDMSEKEHENQFRGYRRFGGEGGNNRRSGGFRGRDE